jgi:prophage antirepressor-like protein
MNINEFMKEVFKFDDKKIKIVGEYENPWFCGKDVCKALGYSDYKDALKKHVHDRKKHNLSSISGGGVSPPPFTHNELQSIYINESGLYDLVFHCRLPIALQFKDWITEEVLPSLRKKGEYNVQSHNVDELTKYFEEQLKLKDHQLEEQQDYISILKDISVSDSQRNCTEVIYIATCNSYAKHNRFKIGGVQSSDKLQQRLSTYNTRSANGDMFFYSDIFMVADYRHAESRVKDLIERFIDRKGKEFYQLHYTELKEIVKYICERYTEEVETINDGLSRLVASLNVQRLRPVIPRPTNHASYVNVINGVPHNKVITNPNEEEFRTQVRHYLSGLLYPVTTIHRRDVFDNISLKVNKTMAWKWIKQEVGDFNPELLSKLQYR